MSDPNIVLIVSDQHRADWMGCAGNSAVRTPHLDGLARDGVRFSAAYCAAPLCVPSRMALLTGRYPHHTGVYTNNASLPSGMPTYAHALGLAGYETVLCGRIHFVGADQRHGYERRLVGDLTACYLGGPRIDYAEWEGGQRQGLECLTVLGPGDSAVLRYDEAVVGACEEFVAARAGAAASRPLLLTVGLFGPHSPFVCPPDLYARAVATSANEPPLPPDPEPRHPWVADWFRRLEADRASPEQIARARVNYVGLVDRLDQLVGRVIAAARALPGPTIVVYLSDHGEMAGDRGMFWKQSFFEGAVKVPLIWCPLGSAVPAETIVPERVVDLPVSLVDLASTLAALGGAPALPATDGRALTPLLRGDPTPAERAVWAARPIFSEAFIAGAPVRMVRRDQQKLIYYHGYEAVQLFDLASDPDERHDRGQATELAMPRAALRGVLLADWDPDQIARDLAARGADERYLARWGREVGMGPLDLWPGGEIYRSGSVVDTARGDAGGGRR